MFTKKVPKCQMADKNEFTSHNFHSIDTKERDWPEIINVLSIDPGIRNLAIRVESRSIRNENCPIKTLLYDKLHIKDTDRELEANIDKLYSLITNFLDQYLNIIENCHILIIERQLPFNLKATRVCQHIISYFMFHLKNKTPSLPMIFEIDPKLKTRELGAPTHLNERGVKQWSVEHCQKLLTKRQDFEALKFLMKQKKKDDLSDIVCQIEALFSFQGWPLTKEIININNNNKKIKLKILQPS